MWPLMRPLPSIADAVRMAAPQVNGGEFLSMCLESKDTDKALGMAERSCWCLFRICVTSSAADASGTSGGGGGGGGGVGSGRGTVHRDSYGRFAADTKGGDNTSLGWNDYMRISDFLAPENAYLVDDTATFSASFYVIRCRHCALKIPPCPLFRPR